MADRKAIVRFEEQGAAQVRRALNDTASEAEKASSRSAKAAEKIGQALGAALAAGATSAVLLINNAINSADALDKLSEKTGITVEDLSRLRVEAQLTGTNLDTLQKMVGRVGDRQLEVSRGNKEITSLFRALGVEVVDSNGKLRDSLDVVRDLQEVFSSLPDGPTKSALAMKLLGRDAQDLLPFLSQTSEEVDELHRLADELGLTISTETAAAAAEFKNNLDVLGLSVIGLGSEIAEELLPDLLRLVEELREFTTQAGGADEIARNVAEGVRLFGTLAQGAVDGVQALTGAAIGLFNTLDGLSRLNPAGWLRSMADGGGAGESFRNAGVAFDLAKLSGAETRINMGLEEGPRAPLPGQGTGRRGGDQRWEDSQEASAAGRRAAAEVRIKAWQDEAEAEAKAAAASAKAKRDAAAAARAQALAERELLRIMEEQRQAAADFQTSLEDMRAELAGPVAQVHLDYQRHVAHLSELHAKGKVSQDDLTEALRLATEVRDQHVAAIERQLSPADEVLVRLREEIELLGMGRLAREKYLAQQAMGPDATEEQRDEAAALIEQRDALQEVADAMDAVRESGAGFLEDWLSDAKSFEDAALGALDNLNRRLLQMATEKLIEQILGSFGSTDGGAAGEGFAGFMQAIFGSAKGNVFSAGDVVPHRLGGVVSGPAIFPMAGGRMGSMAEDGPEAIMPLKRGRDGRLGVEVAGGGSVRYGDTYNINVPAGTDRRQAQRVGHAVATEQRRAEARNR